MNNVNRMSEGQHKFLRKVRDGSWLLPELLKWEKVTGMCLTRWLENKFFGRNFDRSIGISTGDRGWSCRWRRLSHGRCWRGM